MIPCRKDPNAHSDTSYVVSTATRATENKAQNLQDRCSNLRTCSKFRREMCEKLQEDKYLEKLNQKNVYCI
jgi:hypothetical protein